MHVHNLINKPKVILNVNITIYFDTNIYLITINNNTYFTDINTKYINILS